MTKNNLDFGVLAEFAHEMHTQADENATVQKVLEFALTAVGADFAGVLFASRKEGIETVAATDPVVEKADALQLEVQEGPDLDLLDDEVGVLVPDIATEQRSMTLRMLIEGHSDPVSAKRLGVSPRTYAGYISDLKEEFEAETRFQLGYVIGKLGISGRDDDPDDEE